MNTYTTPKEVIDLFLSSKMVSNGTPTDIWPVIQKDWYIVLFRNENLNSRVQVRYNMQVVDGLIKYFY